MAQYVNYEILRQAGAATVDQQTKSLAMGMLKEAGKYAKNAKAKADKIRSEYPEGINVPKVDSDIRPGLVAYLEESKEEYNKAAKQLGLLPSWSPGYKKARDTINRIKDGYANIDNGLKTLQTNRIKAGKIEPGKGATSYEVAKSSDLVSGDYATYDIQFTDQGVTYDDGGERKNISDFVSASGSDGVGSNGQTKLYNQATSDARSKIAWEETDQRSKIDGFVDGMSNTQLKNWMFSGPRSYGYAIALNNLDYNEYPTIEETDDLAVKQQKQDIIDKVDVEIDRLKYSDNLKGEQVRDQLYNALKTTYDKNLPQETSNTGSNKEAFVYQSGTLNFQKSGTYSSGQQIENYISRINDNKIVTFTDTVGDTPVQLEYLPVRGGYQLKGSKDVISKDRLGNVIMGLPKNFSNEVEPIEPFRTKFVKSDKDLKKEEELENVFNSTSSEPIDFSK
tara:strand:- start:2350 stop:3699 length:1350 start_codon:yes stop_codon:yes gene_type:complete